MKSKTKIILLIVAGILVAALIVIVILYYLGYLSASAAWIRPIIGPYCPSTCSFDKAGNTNKFKVKVYNTRAKRYESGVYMTFNTDDCNGSAASSTPKYTTHCTTDSNGECSAKVCVGSRAASYKIYGVKNTPAKCHFETEQVSKLLWGGTLPVSLSGQVRCYGN